MNLLTLNLSKHKEKITEINHDIFPQILDIAVNKLPSFLPDIQKTSLICGYPAYLVFLCDYGSLFLPQDDLQGCYDFLVKKITSSLENNGVKGLSLFDGLAGICQSIAIANSKTFRYEKLLLDLESYLLERLEKDYLLTIKGDIEFNRSSNPDYYDVVSGLSGIAFYLLHSPTLESKKYLKSILELLIKRCQDMNLQSNKVPGWYCPAEYEIDDGEKQLFPNGSFNLGLAHGATGILATLSISAINGFIVEHLLETVKNLSNWLWKQKVNTDYGARWPDKVSLEEITQNKLSESVYFRDGWCYGSAGIARTLFLTGKALKTNYLKEKATNAFLDIFKRSPANWNLDLLSCCHGYSGLLAITHLMEVDTKNSSFQKHKNALMDLILDQYDPNKVWGFFDKESSPENQLENDQIGYLCGILGVVSVLNTSIGWGNTNWIRLFLID